MFSIGDYVKNANLQNKVGIKKINEADLKLLQNSILDVYKDIIYICEKKGFNVMMVAGSAIGAIRHKGFIPWDDDMDLLISRDDYYSFVVAFCEEFGDKYVVTSPFGITKYSDYCIHIIRKDMYLMSLFDMSKIYPNGVGVDICTYENVPDNSFLRFIHGVVSNLLLFLVNSKRIYICRNKYSDAYFNLSIASKTMYYTRIFIGGMLSFISYFKFCSFLDKWISLFHNIKGKKVTIPTGYLHYFGEMVPSDVFDPVMETVFDGVKAFIPNKVDVYLTNRYGNDYMTIPSKEKQEVHSYVEFYKLKSDIN